MKTEDLWNALCGDGNQPWPNEALYDVEGLHYHELKQLHAMLQRGESLPTYEELRECIREREAAGFVLAGPGSKPKEASKAFPLLVKGARRRAMAQALGVTDPREQGALAREAGTALDRVAVAAKRAGVQLDLSRRGSRRELLETATALASNYIKPADSEDPIEYALRIAGKLIEAVDNRMVREEEA